MEGGNGVREANGITQFAESEPKRREVFIPKRRSRKPPLDVGKSPYLQLDGCAVKTKARVPLTLPSRTPKCHKSISVSFPGRSRTRLAYGNLVVPRRIYFAVCAHSGTELPASSIGQRILEAQCVQFASRSFESRPERYSLSI